MARKASSIDSSDRCAEPESLVDSLDDDSFVLCMTKGHQSDLPVLRQIFSRGRCFPYLGVIGSRAKAAVLRKELSQRGLLSPSCVFIALSV
jgi:xanthine dehydrogenase accessory factor